MAFQLILCVETKEKAQTDKIYVMETIRRFYGAIPRSIKINYICVHGKSNLMENGTLRKISSLSSQFRPNGPTYIIYCIDTDQIDRNYNQKIDTNRIISFCQERRFECVWFCRDVEEVYIGHAVDKHDKKRTAENFKKRDIVAQVPENNLHSSTMIKGRSNILLILDRYLQRKKNAAYNR